MFNVLISGNDFAWETDQRMGMMTDRFLEYSGDDGSGISLEKPETLKALERVQTLLLYESGCSGPASEFIRVGQMHDIRIGRGQVTFRFAETGRNPAPQFEKLRQRLQIGDFEMHRTHWAVKDGEIPQDVFAR